MLYKIAAVLFLVLGSSRGVAQLSPEQLLAASSQVKDLELPSEPSRLGVFSSPEMALYKPEGQGPFPALVLHHQCNGLSSGRWQNAAMLVWAKEAVARGYVVLMLDSLGPRNVDTVCMGPRGGVGLARGVKDALQGAEHLRKFAFVDKKRIALAGYSWGAIIGVLASGKQWAATLGPGERFAAVVAFYPGCFTIRPPTTGPVEVVSADIDRPLLVLMGEKDTETPAAECVSKLETARAAGAPVEWHVYPGTTHCWDCENLNGLSKVDVRGNQVVYRYDRTVTEDASRRMFEFLDRNLNARK
jgi:dienelactone hydrolase